MANRNTVNPASRGGLAVVKEYGVSYMREIGSRGGRAVVAKYGQEYMASIGEIGADVVNGHLSKTRRTKIERNIRRIIRENNV